MDKKPDITPAEWEAIRAERDALKETSDKYWAIMQENGKEISALKAEGIAMRRDYKIVLEQRDKAEALISALEQELGDKKWAVNERDKELAAARPLLEAVAQVSDEALADEISHILSINKPSRFGMPGPFDSCLLILRAALAYRASVRGIK